MFIYDIYHLFDKYAVNTRPLNPEFSTQMNKNKRSIFTKSFSTESERDSISVEREYVAEVLEQRVLFSAAPVDMPDQVETISTDAKNDSGGESFDSLNSLLSSGNVAIPSGETEISANDSVILSSLDNLTAGELEKLADAAVARWKDAGISDEQAAFLDDIRIEVVDLTGSSLGAAEGTTIYLDWNAAGYDWFIDETPFEDEEFEFAQSTTVFRDLDGPARYGIDLITVLSHEMGHVLGLEDIQAISGANSLMYSTLDEGVRRIASDGLADGAVAGSLVGIHNLDAANKAPGDMSVYVGGSGEVVTQNSATSPFEHTFSTTVKETDTSHELVNVNGTNDGVALAAGHHLVIYNSRFDDDPSANPGGERTEIQTKLNLNGSDQAIGWSQGYDRRGSGDDEMITSGGGIINVAGDGDILQLESFTTDATTEVDVREADSTGLQLLKLDDSWNYATLTVDTTQASAVTTTTFNNVVYDTASLTGGGAGYTYNGTSGALTLSEGGHYMVFANTFIDAGNTGTRASYFQQLALDGTALDGTTTTVYLRGTEGTYRGSASIGTIINVTAGQELSVQMAQEQNDGTSNRPGAIVGGRSALTIVKLPDTAQFVDLENPTDDGQNLNPGGANAGPNTAVVYDTVNESDASFSQPDTSTIEVGAADSYLFLNQWFYGNDADGGTANDRQNVNQGYQVNNGGALSIGQSSRYNRSDNPNTSAGNWGGAMLDLVGGDQVQVLTGRLGAGSTAPSDHVGVQGVRIASLFTSILADANSGLTTTAAVPPATNPVLDVTDSVLKYSGGGGVVTYTVDAAPSQTNIGFFTLATDSNLPDNGGSDPTAATPLTTFTQTQIDAGDIKFVAGNGGFGTFTLGLNDGSDTASASFAVAIQGSRQTTVAEAGSVTITAGILNEQTATNNGNISYTITREADGGEVRLNGVRVRETQSFTQADIEAGNVTFVHTDGEVLNENFTVEVFNALGASFATATVNLTVGLANDPLVFTINGQTTAQAQTVLNSGSTTITGISIVDGDADLIDFNSDADTSLTISLSNSTDGSLTLNDDIIDGLSASEISGNGTHSITINPGLLRQINRSLSEVFDGLVYTAPTSSPPASTTLTLSLTTPDADLSNTTQTDRTINLTLVDPNFDPANLTRVTDENTNVTIDLTDATVQNSGIQSLVPDNGDATADFVLGDGNHLGFSVDVDGDLAIVGNEGTGDHEQVLLYRFDRGNTNTWILDQVLLSDTPFEYDDFGYSVRIWSDGNGGGRAFVGAQLDDSGGTDRGTMFVYEYNPFEAEGERWVRTQNIRPANENDSEVGAFVDVSEDGNYLVFGAPEDDRDVDDADTLGTTGTNSGGVYIYEWNGTGYSEVQKLKAQNSDGTFDIQQNDEFGRSVGVTSDGSGNATIVVGQRWNDTGGGDRGAAYVYTLGQQVTVGTGTSVDEGIIFASRGEGNTTQIEINADTTTDRLLSFDTTTTPGTIIINLAVTGNAIDLTANIVDTVVAAFNGDVNVQALNVSARAAGDGSASILNGGAAETAQALGAAEFLISEKLQASNAGNSDNFGIDVDISGGTIVVGAYLEDSGSTDRGSVYIFNQTQTNDDISQDVWNQDQRIGSGAVALANSDQFGISVALEDDSLVVGAWLDDGPNNSGQIFVFNRTPGNTNFNTNNEQALKHAGATDHDNLGREVGITHDPVSGEIRVIAGAPGKNLTIPLGGGAPDVTAFDYGAAFIFDGALGSISETQMLSQVDLAGDELGTRAQYGRRVAASQDIIVVGAPHAGDPGLPQSSTNDLPGVAYVYQRDDKGTADESDDTWTLLQTLESQFPSNDDNFGYGVAVSADGSTIVIGSPFEDIGGTNRGMVQVFTSNGSTFDFKGHIRPTGGANEFGRILTLNEDGSVLVVGERNDDDGGSNTGSGHVYTAFDGWDEFFGLGPTVVAEGDKLLGITDFANHSSDELGRSVAISGNRIVIGGHADDWDDGTNGDATGNTSSRNRGSAYVFEYDEFASHGILDASVGGGIIAVSSSTLEDVTVTYVVGTAGTGTTSAAVNGTDVTVTLSSVDGTTGTATAQNVIDALNNDTGGLISASGFTGSSVRAFDANTVITNTLDKGTQTLHQWQLIQKLVGADTGQDDQFGISVAISGDTIAIGSYLDDDGGGDRGAVYIFDYNGTSWTETEKIQASDAANSDQFGRSGVSLDGDRLLVAAYADDDPTSNAGSAYLFERSGGSFSQIEKFSNPNSGTTQTTQDDFYGGFGAALAGDTVVVGAERFDLKIGNTTLRDYGGAFAYHIGDTGTTIVSIDTTGTVGSVVDNLDGTLTFQPGSAFDHLAEGESQTTTFTYTVQDGNGLQETRTVTVTVNGIQDTIASDQVVTIDEDALQTAAGGVGGVLGDPANTVLAGAQADFNAASVTSGDPSFTNWANDGSWNGSLDLDPALSLVAVSSSHSGITHAFDFPGGTTADTAPNSGTRLGAQFNTGLGELGSGSGGTVDVTFEIWFKPDSLSGTRQIISETGGGTGSGFYLEGSNLRFYQAPSGTDFSYDITGLEGDFIQAAVTLKPGGEAILYVNGQQVATGTAGADWDGGDPAALGTKGGSNAGGIGGGNQNSSPFDGQIAIYRQYNGTAMSAAQVLANYNGVNNPPSTNPGGTSPFVVTSITDPSSTVRNPGESFTVDGHTVVVAADGQVTITPSPGTAFRDLAEGETRDLTETFTLNTVDSGPKTVTLRISGRNDAPVITDNDDVITSNDLNAVITEDDTNSVGNTVTQILTGNLDADGTDAVTDYDNGATLGIAITDSGVTTGTGTWEYSTDGGSIWNALGTPTETTALLLVGTDRIRFVPDTIDTATATITYKGWDQTDGSSSGTVLNLTGVGGGTSAFSSGTATSTITVTAVNENPVATDDALTTSNQATLNGNVITVDNGNGLDSDEEGSTLTVDTVNGSNANVGVNIDTAKGGRFNITANGTLTYSVIGGTLATLTGGATDTDSVTYTVVDPQSGTSNTATVTVTVVGANKPTAVDDSYSTNEDDLLTVLAASGVLINEDTEAENPNLSVADGDFPVSVDVGASDTVSANGAIVSFSSDGGFTYDGRTSMAIQSLAAGETLVDTFDYVLVTANGVPDTGTVSVTVTGQGTIEINTAHTLPDGTTVTGADASDDVITVSDDGTTLTIDVNGTTVRTVALANIPSGVGSSINIVGSSDNDTVNIGPITAGTFDSIDIDSVGGSIETLNVVGNVDMAGAINARAAQINLGASGGISITSAGNQVWTGPVDLVLGDVQVTSSAGSVDFGGTINSDPGSRALTVSSATGTEFDASIGNTTALRALAVIGAGPVLLGDTAALSITTTNQIVLSPAVDLAQDATLSGSTVTFGGAVNEDGTATASNLDVTATSGKITFLSTIGDSVALDSLTANAAIRTEITGATVNVTGATSVTGDLNTNSGAPLTVTSAGLSVSGTADFDNATSVSINSAGGDVSLAVLDSVNGVTVSASNNTTVSGATTLIFGDLDITATTNVDLTGAVTLPGNLIVSNAGGTFTAGSTVGLGGDAAITSANATITGTLTGAAGSDLTFTVSNATSLATITGVDSLNTDAPGTTTLNGDVALTGGATSSILDPVTLGGDVTLTGGTSAVTLTTVNGASAFTVGAGSGGVSLGVLGGATPLSTFTTQGTGAVTLGGNVNTVGAQTYGANHSAINASGDLTLNSSGGVVTIGSSIAGADSLTVNGSYINLGADLTVNGGSATATAFNAAVVLTDNVTVTQSGSENTQFASSIDSVTGQTYSLTVNAGTGTAEFSGDIGEDALGGLTGDALGAFTVNGNAQFNAKPAPSLTTPTLNFDASLDTDGNSDWESETANQTQNWTFGGDVTRESVTTPFNNITHAYRFTDGAADTTGQLESLGDTNDTTWEFWIKPDDLGIAPQILVESGGGGTGMAIWYDPGTPGDNTGTVNFTIDNGSNRRTASAVIDTTEFRHILAVYHRDEATGAGQTDLQQLFVDGVLLDDTDTSTSLGTDDPTEPLANTDGINDWSGGDASGLGNSAGGLAETVPLSGDYGYDGDMAAFRLYIGTAFTPLQAIQAFQAEFIDATKITVNTTGDQNYTGAVDASATNLEIDAANVSFSGTGQNLNVGTNNLSLDLTGTGTVDANITGTASAAASGTDAGTSVTFTADNSGTIGNITLNFDGLTDIDTFLNDPTTGWNILNPNNTISHSGIGTETPAGPVTLSGGTDSLTIENATTVTLKGTNTVTGATTVATGTLVVDSGASHAGAINMDGSSVLEGTGSIAGAVNLKGTATIDPAGSVEGTLSVGNLFLGSGQTVTIDVNDKSGDDFDVISVTGTVNIDGATLNTDGLAQNFTEGVDVITIISNDSTDAITGTFNGLTEGQAIFINGVRFEISYAGGTDNNDVTLARLDVPPPVATGNDVTVDEDVEHVFTADTIAAQGGDAGDDENFLFDDNTSGNTFAGVVITTVPTNGEITLSGATVTAGQFISLADITAGNLKYKSAPNNNANTSFTFQVRDSQNGDSTPATTLNIAVNAINDTPVNSVPGSQTVDQGEILTFSSANGNQITVDDSDTTGGNTVTLDVTLTGAAGTILTLGGITGLTGVTGNGTSNVVTFSGDVTQTTNVINDALNGLQYSGFGPGAADLTITINDGGNIGADPGASGGLTDEEDSDTISVTVNDVNTTPQITAPASIGLTENADNVTVLTQEFSTSEGTLISVSDDSGANDIQVLISVPAGSGTLKLATLSGLSAVTGDDSETINMSGPLSALNTALDGLVWTAPNADFFGSFNLSITVNDAIDPNNPVEGHSGTGGFKIGVKTIPFTITNVNDNPVITTSASQSVAENTTAVVDIESTDVDNETEGGGLTYAITGGVDQGLFSINTATGELSFQSAPDFETPGDAGGGATSAGDNIYEVQVTVTDGSSATGVQDFQVTVTNANDIAPVITGTFTDSVVEGQTATNIDLGATDTDGQTENGGGITYSITGGADQAFFSIDTNTGVLSFATAPDFDATGNDSDNNNVYEVEVTANDGVNNSAAQAISVTVTNSIDAIDNAYSADSTGSVSGNVITDNTGSGADTTTEGGEFLFVSSVDTTGLNGKGILSITQQSQVAAYGTVNLTDNTVSTVNFGAGVFTNAVVIVGPVGQAETEPTIARVSNVNAAAGTFDIVLKEQPDTASGTGAADGDGELHATESISWIVLEAGQYTLPNGSLMEVGTVSTVNMTGEDPFQTVNFASSFTTTPVVMASVQTANGTDQEELELFGMRMDNLGQTSFQVILEEPQGFSTTPRTTAETIGYVAIEPGQDQTGGNLYEAGSRSGVDGNLQTITFGSNFASAPIFIASLADYAGGDPSQLRYNNLNASTVQVEADEDSYFDTERDHAAELVTYFALNSANSTLEALPQGPQGLFTFDTNGDFSGLAPGATEDVTFTYTLSDLEGNTDTATVTITVTGKPATVYVDNNWVDQNAFDTDGDADDGEAGTQTATFGTDAFNNLADALNAVGEDCTIVINPGSGSSYGSFNLNKTGVTLKVSGGNVILDSLDTLAGTTLDLNGNTVTLGDASGDNTFAGQLADTATGGGLTKTGADKLIFSGQNVSTSAITVSAGSLEIGGEPGDIVNNATVIVNVPGFTFTADAPITGTGDIQVTTGTTLRLDIAGGGSLSSGTVSVASGATFEVDGATTLTNNFTIEGGTIRSVTGNQTYEGTITANSGTSHFLTNGNIIYIDGDLTGAGNVEKDTGDTGSLVLRGNVSANQITNNGGTLRIGENNTGAKTSSAAIINNAFLRFGPNTAGTSVTQSGSISGTGIVETLGNGTVTLSVANNFSGDFILGDAAISSIDGASGTNEGIVIVGNSNSLGTGTIISRGAQLQAGTSGINISNNINIDGGGLRTGGSNDFELSGTIALINTTTGRGVGNYSSETGPITVTLSGTQNLDNGGYFIEGTNGANNGAFNITGNITGSGDLSVLDSFDGGQVTVSGSNDYTGSTAVSAGTFVLNATHTGGGAYTVNTGSTLEGTGSTDSAVTVNTGGTIAPGVGSGNTGILTTGTLTVDGTISVDINDLGTAGTDYDQIIVNGDLDIDGGALEALSDGTFTSEAIITLINNAGSNPITGTFTNRAEGSTVSVAGNNLAISYLGDTGNDVTLDSTGISVGPNFTINDSDAGGNHVDAEGDITVVEDNGDQVNDPATPYTFTDHITFLNGGAGEADTLANIEILNVSDPSLFTGGGQPALVAGSTANDRTLTFTTASNASGFADITVRVTDTGSGVAPSENTSEKTFRITVSAQSDDPNATLGDPDYEDTTDDPFALETLQELADRAYGNAPAIIIKELPGNTQGILNQPGSSGLDPVALNDEIPVDELANLIFQPDTTGTSTWNGTLRFAYSLRNADGTESGTIYFGTSAPQEAPLRASASVTVNQDVGATTISNFASVDSGDVDSSKLRFEVTSAKPELFAESPTLGIDGTLRFTPATSGSGVVIVQLTDGLRTYSSQSFLVTVNSVPGGGVFSGAGNNVTPLVTQSLVFDLFGRNQGLRDSDSSVILAFSGSGTSFDSQSVIDALLGGQPGSNPGGASVMVFTDLGEFQRTLRKIVTGEGSLNFRVFDLDRLESGDVAIHGGERIRSASDDPSEEVDLQSDEDSAAEGEVKSLPEEVAEALDSGESEAGFAPAKSGDNDRTDEDPLNEEDVE